MNIRNSLIRLITHPIIWNFVLPGIIVTAIFLTLEFTVTPVAPVIVPNGSYSVPGTTMTIVNNSRHFILVDEDAVRSVITINGNGTCWERIIIDPDLIMSGATVNGETHINGSNELQANAGLFGWCYVSRFGPSHEFEAQLYDGEVLGLAQAARLNGKSYTEFVSLVGGQTYLSRESYEKLFVPYGLPLTFLTP